MKSTRVMSSNAVASLSLALGLLACAPATEETKDALSSSKPADSQGKVADIQLHFQSAAAVSTALMANLDLGNGVSITEARINVAKIKIKLDEMEDEAEEELESELKSMRESKEEGLADQKKALEEQMEAIKKDFEEQIKNAATEAEKNTLEAAQKARMIELEESLAAQLKTMEDELDAYEEQRDADLKWKGAYVFDVVTNTVSPEIPVVSVWDGTYRRLEFELKPNRVIASTDPLFNHSVYVAGTVNLSGAAVPFTYALRLSEEFKIAVPDGASVQPDIANSLVVAFNPAIWFAGVDFSAAKQNASGTIVIDENNNTAFLDSIKEKIKDSTDFGKDDDGDGELEDEESSDKDQE